MPAAGREHDHPPWHEHPHEHRHRPPGRLWELLVPHSHDAAGKLDSVLQTDRAGMRCVAISFLALLVTALLQAAVVLASGSVALRATHCTMPPTR